MNQDEAQNGDVFEPSVDQEDLTYALDRLATWGESADPRLRAECSRIAQAAFKRITRGVTNGE